MRVGPLLLVAVSLGLSNFAVAIGIGLAHSDLATRIRTGLVFAFFEALMPALGLLLGQPVAGPIGEVARYVGGALLVVIGGYGLVQARSQAGRPQTNAGSNLRQLVPAAAAISLDNLVVGFALSFSNTSIVLAVAIIAAVSVGMALVGLELGNRLEEHVGEWAEELGAIVMILVGLAIALGLF